MLSLINKKTLQEKITFLNVNKNLKLLKKNCSNKNFFMRKQKKEKKAFEGRALRCVLCVFFANRSNAFPPVATLSLRDLVSVVRYCTIQTSKSTLFDSGRRRRRNLKAEHVNWFRLFDLSPGGREETVFLLG